MNAMQRWMAEAKAAGSGSGRRAEESKNKRFHYTSGFAQKWAACACQRAKASRRRKGVRGSRGEGGQSRERVQVHEPVAVACDGCCTSALFCLFVSLARRHHSRSVTSAKRLSVQARKDEEASTIGSVTTIERPSLGHPDGKLASTSALHNTRRRYRR